MTHPVSIVIRAYNEEQYLGRLLAGIRQQTLVEAQVVLIDSGSTDNTLRIAQENGAETVSIRPEEFTFGRSLNYGIAATRHPLVVIASAHVYPVYPDWLERLIEPLTDPRVGLSYGKQRGAPSSRFSEHQVFHQWFPDAAPAVQAHPFCNNANAAIQRGLWEQHPYDESLPGLEDLAWARWAFEQGLRITYVPEAEVVHVHQETPHGVYNRYKREGMAFKQIYPQEQFHLSDFVRLFSGNAISDFREAAHQGKLGKSWQEILWFRWNQFWGTYQGYRRSGPLTWQLRQAFYYPRQGGMPTALPRRDVQPIQYVEASSPADTNPPSGDR